jgi:calcineurin-like phosphoesterase family protein
MRVGNKLWLISDTHFGHQNIVKFQQRPTNHEAIMLSEWIHAVRDDDQILHLGDVFLGKQGNPARWAAILSRMPGEKFLILGNHDKAAPSLYERAGFKIVKPFAWRGVAFTHRPISEEWPLPGAHWSTNIHGHTHGNAHNPDHDGTHLAGKRYINICVELTEYKPVRLGNVCPL